MLGKLKISQTGCLTIKEHLAELIKLKVSTGHFLLLLWPNLRTKKRCTRTRNFWIWACVLVNWPFPLERLLCLWIIIILLLSGWTDLCTCDLLNVYLYQKRIPKLCCVCSVKYLRPRIKLLREQSFVGACRQLRWACPDNLPKIRRKIQWKVSESGSGVSTSLLAAGGLCSAVSTEENLHNMYVKAKILSLPAACCG